MTLLLVELKSDNASREETNMMMGKWGLLKSRGPDVCLYPSLSWQKSNWLTGNSQESSILSHKLTLIGTKKQERFRDKHNTYPSNHADTKRGSAVCFSNCIFVVAQQPPTLSVKRV